jgi:hypothetical protein
MLYKKIPTTSLQPSNPGAADGRKYQSKRLDANAYVSSLFRE